MSIDEIYEIAEQMGWSVELDNNNQLVIYTNVYDEDPDYDDDDDSYEEEDQLYFIDDHGELSAL